MKLTHWKFLQQNPQTYLALRDLREHPSVGGVITANQVLTTMKENGFQSNSLHSFKALISLTPSIRVVMIGCKQSGKSTAAAAIGAAYCNVKVVDTSNAIYSLLASRKGVTEEALRQLPKENLREDLIQLGDELTDQHPLALIEDSVLAGEFVIAGIRKIPQLKAARELGSLVLWIERDGHDPDGIDNLELSARDADAVVYNNGSDLLAFQEQVMAVFRERFTLH